MESNPDDKKPTPTPCPPKEGEPDVHNAPEERGLTLMQQKAVELLVGGANDRETAQMMLLNRSTVTRWRRLPAFQAALKQRRTELWSGTFDHLRCLVTQTLACLGEEMDGSDGTQRLKAAIEVLKLLNKAPGVIPEEPKASAEPMVPRPRAIPLQVSKKPTEDDSSLPAMIQKLCDIEQRIRIAQQLESRDELK